ncbi:MAG: CBS domain-containing protein [Gemmatimonadota bacterium]|nr:MAG: CBS domain-containing protein [Gemmatimonadota bacterium]
MKQVREVMVPIDQYPSVRDNATLAEAIAVIDSARLDVGGRKSQPRLLLVFDEIQLLVGYVRRRDIMRGLEPQFLVSQPLEYRKMRFDVPADPNLTELPFDRTVSRIRQQAGKPVSDVMLPIPTTINADDHLMKAIHEMVTLNLYLIPVIDKKRLVGVVRSVDMIHELAQLLK